MYADYQWSTNASGPAAAFTQAGTYSVTVTDDRGCTAVDSIAEVAFTPPGPEIFGPDGLCPSEGGMLNVAPFSAVDWGGNNQDLNLSISAPGTYSVTVVDDNGCTGTDTFEVLAYANPEPQISGDTSLCEGGTLSLFVDEAYVSYDWGSGNLDSLLLVNAPGAYSVTVTSAQGCSGSTNAIVDEFPNPVLQLDDNAAFCANSSVVLDANGIYSAYAWSNGGTGATTEVDSAGIYQLLVTNAFGCTASDEITVAEEAVPVSGLNGPYTFCENDSVSIQVAQGYQSYEWSVPAQGNTLVVDDPGTYYVTITGNNNCVTVDSLEAEALMLPSPEITGGPNLCIGSSLELESSMPFFTYQWEDGTTNSVITIGSPGQYGLTVTDANGCIGTTNTTITEVQLPDPNVPDSTAFCENGDVDLVAAPGFDTYLWSNGETTPVVEVDLPGTYALTVTDANSCQDSFLIIVTENPLPSINLQGPMEFCEGDSITLSVAPAEYPFVTWSTGSEDAESVIFEPGVYQVSVLDERGCIRDSVFNIEELLLPELEIAGAEQICENDSTTLIATPGLSDYVWSTGAISASLLVDSSAIYTVSAVGSNGCQNTASFDFDVIELPVIPLPDSARFCEDGSVLIGVPDNPLYSYQWFDGLDQSEREVDQPGVYSLIATTQEGCFNTSTIFVEEIAEPDAFIMGDLSLCPGDTNVLSASETNYSFLWSTGDTLREIQVESPGPYNVTVTDVYGCTSSANAIVLSFSAPDVEITGEVPFCEQDTITLSAGNHDLYEWSDGSESSNLPVTLSGAYAVTVTNASGCTAADTIQISAFPLPDPGLPDIQAGCDGDNFQLIAQPGFASYQWSTDSASEMIIVQTAGIYTVEVTDENGCSVIDSTEVFIQPTPQVNVTPAQNICEGNTAIVAVQGEWESVNWSTGETTDSILVSEQGGIGVTVTDSLGCTASSVTAVFVFTVDAPVIVGDTGFCPLGEAIFEAEQGYASYNWSNGMDTPQIAVTEEGVYSVTVQDTVGCVNTS
ncbi:MAG: hypothetical protein KI786_10795, partial [Mameliella sp.]|nr:hypothetical protein [Phaeodactylibacter sp.]